MKKILSIASFFSLCPLRRIPGGNALLKDKPIWRDWSGPVREIEVRGREEN